MKKKVVFIVTLFATISFATSQHSLSFEKCLEGKWRDAEMAACTYEETKLEDKRLNQAYKKAMQTIKKDKRDELKEVQRAWIKYRDLNCNFNSYITGGTMDQLFVAECFLSMTKERANELEFIAEISNGDLED
ncbi:LprI family protein (DUF1311 domain) [Aliarcobacter faecis]|uniref:lysozyme inhibitor LprI family protein n=1 Tax=Aliarcobacter faecis TaxID=1564138 RepID=UPI0004BC8DE0|nr:lysozyme inhibitor LprI family protein [Aliarcobacter faecis]QKF73852.1 LprI family protein (DUF1311 domain) [Aliarcobacter faecis]